MSLPHHSLSCIAGMSGSQAKPEDPRDTITIERLQEKDTAVWLRILNHSSPGLTEHLLRCTKCSPDFCDEAREKFIPEELLAA